MFNIKDKDLRYKLWQVGIVVGKDDELTTNAYHLVSKVNIATQKLDAIANHLGLVFIENNEQAPKWKLLKKGSPEADLAQAQEGIVRIWSGEDYLHNQKSNLSGVREKRSK